MATRKLLIIEVLIKLLMKGIADCSQWWIAQSLYRPSVVSGRQIVRKLSKNNEPMKLKKKQTQNMLFDYFGTQYETY